MAKSNPSNGSQIQNQKGSRFTALQGVRPIAAEYRIPPLRTAHAGDWPLRTQTQHSGANCRNVVPSLFGGPDEAHRELRSGAKLSLARNKRQGLPKPCRPMRRSFMLFTLG
jgi:hypothetical protein